VSHRGFANTRRSGVALHLDKQPRISEPGKNIFQVKLAFGKTPVVKYEYVQ